MNSSTLPHNNSSTLPVVWNPQIPLELIVFERCIRDGEVKGGAKITPYSLFAKSGVAEACNEHERAALMQLVFLHEEFHNPSNITNNAFDESEKESAEVALKVSALMQQYRATVRDCLLAWNEADSSPPSSSQQVDGSNHVPTNDSSRENWTLLSQMHAVMHLAEIYLPLHAPFSNRINNNSGTLWRYQDVDLLEIPGYVTADTVRYLRTHTLQTAARSLNVPMEQLADMIDSKYPELNAFYWPYVMALVHRGCLDLVWTIISAHSLFRAHTAEESPDSEQQQDMNKHSRLASSTDRATSREIVADFWLLKSALLTAPLPGGRSEEQDDEDRSPDIDYDTNEMVDGVEFGSCFPSDYRLWDTTDRAYKGGPLQFSPKDALRKYNEWRNHVEELRQRFRLSHKIPQLDEVLACLVGDFSKCSFGSWTEQWCAELLYLAPDTRPRHMSLRALKLQKGSHSTDMNKAEIHIMDGNAGRALTTLNTFGGGSGAALPSTLAALLFIAFSDAGYIPNDTLGLKVSYITEAASDVVASFQNSFHSDLAAQAAVRLLLPYLSLHEQIRALISNILEHYTPTTGEYARTIVSLVREPLEHGYKSLELLESCTSVLMYVYKKYKTKGEAGPATVALLSGIELEDLVLPNRRLGVFHERLTEECHALSLTLLEAVGDKLLHNVVCEFQKARSMCHEFETYKGTFDCCEIVAVAALTHVVAIYQATVVPTDRKKDVGDRIIALLSKSANGLEDSTPITFHYPCLKIARTLTTECRLTCNSSAASTPFDLEGVTVLMQRQAGCAFWRRENTGDYDESDELMVLSLAHCQAIRAENAKKQQFVRRHDSGKSLPVKDSIQYANLSKMEPSERKQFVKKMMDFRY